jgi:bifunctional non-homologous end joining protein LigD
MAVVPKGEEIAVGRRRFVLTNRDKLLFPQDGLTKGDLVAYYRDVAGVMLPHLRGRPLMLQRCPDGVAGGCFYQKEASAHFPEWVARVEVPKDRGVVHHVLCEDEATLAYLAGQACITFHAWTSRADRPDRPDRVVLDFDPSGPDFEPVRAGALAARRLLEEVGLTPFVGTTGSRGVHVVAPIDRRAGFEDVRDFAVRLGEVLVDADTENLTLEFRKDRRQGRVLVDVMRNGYSQTAVVPYSVRVLPGAPVAVPVTWAELESGSVSPRAYDVGSLRRRLDAAGDTWADLARNAHPLAGARRRLEALAPAR